MTIDYKGLMGRVRANREALDACKGPHDFQDSTPERKIGKEYTCTRCFGVVDSIYRYWYELGRRHERQMAERGE